jgi:photosystem II stability/assembly factor-like uncharacterized protein
MAAGTPMRERGPAGCRRAARLGAALAACAGLLAGAAPPSSAQREAARAGYAMTAPLAAKAPLLGIARAGKRLVAVGDHGIVLLSDDEGARWRQAAEVPTRTTLTGVTFADERRGWAVGHGGVILATEDGGERWTRQHGSAEQPDVLLSVWFGDARHGLAVGAYGLALQTRDGGARWERVELAQGEDADRHLNHVFAGGGDALFIAAENGRVLRSADRGGRWEPVTLPYEGSLWGGMRLADGNLLVWGMRGNALLSRDGGTRWEAVATGTDQSLTAGAELPDGRVALVGLGGALVWGDPRSGRLEATIRPDRQVLTGVQPVAAGGLLLLGQSGVLDRWVP